MKYLVLIGPPGSGKGTLSLKLKSLGFLHISTGDLLRDEIKSGSELGKEIAQLIDHGLMVDDDVSLKVMTKAIKQATNGVIFDGYPRNLTQLNLLETHLIKHDLKNLYIIYLNVPLKKLKNRIIYRYTCPVCGEIYHLKNKPPLKKENAFLCSKDQEVLNKRKDDNLESLATRFNVFKEKTQPVIDTYRKYNNFFEIDGTASADKIFKQVEKILNNS